MDGFGFMLAYGDLTWVPFTYSLQARYLVEFPQVLSWQHVMLVLAVQFLGKACPLAQPVLTLASGYSIFRGANGQKDQFKRDPAHPSVQRTSPVPS